jgi:hypothetical protein
MRLDRARLDGHNGIGGAAGVDVLSHGIPDSARTSGTRAGKCGGRTRPAARGSDAAFTAMYQHSRHATPTLYVHKWTPGPRDHVAHTFVGAR